MPALLAPAMRPRLEELAIDPLQLSELAELRLAPLTARAIHVHPQTVRYRLNQRRVLTWCR